MKKMKLTVCFLTIGLVWQFTANAQWATVGSGPTGNTNTFNSVGVGTDAISHRLEVLGGDNVAAFASSGQQAFIRLWANAAGGIAERVEFVNRGSGTAAIWTPGSGDALTVARGGNIGIGNNQPSHKLHVTGGDNIAAFASSGTSAYIRLWANGAGGMAERVEFVNRGNGKATIWTPGAGDALIINRDGKVGIGTNNIPDGYKLYVNQGILTEKIKVAVNGSSQWADYVFASDYKLMPLDKVEQYIKDNQHLPNVPSAAEMVKEGNDLGKTSAKLLEKIEELTLYMIDLKKENATLKAEHQVQQREMEALKRKIFVSHKNNRK